MTKQLLNFTRSLSGISNCFLAALALVSNFGGGFYFAHAEGSFRTAELTPRLSIKTGLEHTSGKTAFAIAGASTDFAGNTVEYHYPLSSLEFPYSAQMAFIEAGLRITPRSRIIIRFSTSVAHSGENLTDLDYLDADPMPEIVSVMPIEDFQSLVIDVKAAYDLKQNAKYRVTIAAGIEYMELEFKAGAGYARIDELGYLDEFGGPSIGWEQKNLTPYVEIGYEHNLGKRLTVGISARFGQSLIDGKDTHYLRDLTQKGSYDGSFVSGKLFITYALTPHVSFFIEGETKYYDASGSTQQEFPPGSREYPAGYRVDNVSTTVEQEEYVVRSGILVTFGKVRRRDL